MANGAERVVSHTGRPTRRDPRSEAGRLVDRDKRCAHYRRREADGLDVASGDTRPRVGAVDVTMMHSSSTSPA
jgi:hypothetical protein